MTVGAGLVPARTPLWKPGRDEPCPYKTPLWKAGQGRALPLQVLDSLWGVCNPLLLWDMVG